MTSKPRLPDPGYGRWWRIASSLDPTILSYEPLDEDELYLSLMAPGGGVLRSTSIPWADHVPSYIKAAKRLIDIQEAIDNFPGDYKYNNGELVDLHG